MSIDLTSVPNEELEAELEKRRLAAKPKPLENPDLTTLITLCQNYVEVRLIDEEDELNELENDIFEEAMMCILGKDIFDWIIENT